MEAVALVIVLCLLALLAWTAWVRVPEGFVYTLRSRSGRSRQLAAGHHLRLPLWQRIVRRVDLLGHSLDLEVPDLRASNGEPCAARGRVFFQVVDADGEQAAVEHPEEVVVDAAVATLRGLPEAGLSTACETMPLEQFNRALKQALNERLRCQGLMVVRCQLELNRAA